MGPLLPFEELVNEAITDGSCKEEKNCSNNTQEDSALPQPHALLHVTSRRKATTKKKTSLVYLTGPFFQISLRNTCSKLICCFDRNAPTWSICKKNTKIYCYDLKHRLYINPSLVFSFSFFVLQKLCQSLYFCRMV